MNSGARWLSEKQIDRIARRLMEAWANAEGEPVGIAYVATFADMARALLAGDGPHCPTCTW